MARPNPAELMTAIATILEGAPNAGIVCADPRAAIDPTEYAQLVMDTSGTVDGWVVEAGAESPFSSVGNILEQRVSFFLTALVSYDENRADGRSYAYFGAKVEAARSAFTASYRLGYESPYDVKHFGLRAPDGYTRLQLDTLEVHVAAMELEVLIREC